MTFSKTLVVGLVALFALSQLIDAASPPSLRLQLGKTFDACNPVLEVACDDHCATNSWPELTCKQGPASATSPQWFTCTCSAVPLSGYLDVESQPTGQSGLDVGVGDDDDDTINSNVLLDLQMGSLNEDSLEEKDSRNHCNQIEDSKCKYLCGTNGFSGHICTQTGQPPLKAFTYCYCKK